MGSVATGKRKLSLCKQPQGEQTHTINTAEQQRQVGRGGEEERLLSLANIFWMHRCTVENVQISFIFKLTI